MKLKKKAVYLKGLMDGLDLDKSTKEGKALLAMHDLLQDLVGFVSELDDDMDQVYEELDAIDEDMDDLEELLGVDDDEEEDEDDEEEADEEDSDEDVTYEYELTCPKCGAVTIVDEDALFNEQVCCGNCGSEFQIEVVDEDAEEEPEEDKE